jgi:hypothetical protein
LLLLGVLGADVALEGTPAVGQPTTPVLLLPTVLGVERVPLPRLRGEVEVKVDPLRSTIAISAPKDLGTIAARVSRNLGHICPSWEVAGSGVLLRCRTKHLQASVSGPPGKQFIDIQELRGLPRDGEDQRIELFYDPAHVGAGGACPGTTPAGRGECAHRDGKWQEAEVQFKLGLESYDRPLAALRLGDLAARRGDYNAAALMWNRAGTLGPFGRLAAARLCELRGSCMEGKAKGLFDGGELPEPMRTELALRAARVDAFAGRHAQVLKRITDLLARPETGGCVTRGQAFCRRLIWWAMEAAPPEHAAEALELYLSLPGRIGGPHAMQMARAAAEQAAILGAPVFAGNLMASVAGSVAPGDMPEHLMRTAELFLAGGDRPRAQLLLDYADSRLSPRQLGGSRWAAVRRGLASPEEPGTPVERIERLQREILTTEAARDLANAMTALARTRAALP